MTMLLHSIQKYKAGKFIKSTENKFCINVRIATLAFLGYIISDYLRSSDLLNIYLLLKLKAPFLLLGHKQNKTKSEHRQLHQPNINRSKKHHKITQTN